MGKVYVVIPSGAALYCTVLDVDWHLVLTLSHLRVSFLRYFELNYSYCNVYFVISSKLSSLL